MNRELWEERLCLLVRDSWVYNDIVTLLPVDRCGNAVLVTKLQRIDNANDLVLRRIERKKPVNNYVM